MHLGLVWALATSSSVIWIEGEREKVLYYASSGYQYAKDRLHLAP